MGNLFISDGIAIILVLDRTLNLLRIRSRLVSTQAPLKNLATGYSNDVVESQMDRKSTPVVSRERGRRHMPSGISYPQSLLTTSTLVQQLPEFGHKIGPLEVRTPSWKASHYLRYEHGAPPPKGREASHLFVIQRSLEPHICAPKLNRGNPFLTPLEQP